MAGSLMLIESPNKIKTIGKYLAGKDIKIMATVGHIRELNEKYYGSLGFCRKTYDIKWKTISDRKFKGKTYDVIESINREADMCDMIYLSTDPDREGEAISWHIMSVLSEKNRRKCKRIVFNEITRNAIGEAMDNPRDIDEDQVNSYLARKLLDRGIGFGLSAFASKTVGGLSAGRVQSIALKFLKDRYEEIANFVPEHWFNLSVTLENGLELTLKSIDSSLGARINEGVRNSLINFLDESDARLVMDSLGPHFKLVEIGDPRAERQQPPRALKTSTMQQLAINRLRMSSREVDVTAQRLYEGVEVGGEFISLITYPRTDREDLSLTFMDEAHKFIISNYSKGHIPKSVRGARRSDLVQGAHEGIRPTNVALTPDELRGKLPEAELNLYKLIWSQAVASLMAPAVYRNVQYLFNNGGNVFMANHQAEEFDGFKALFRDCFGRSEDDKVFPDNLRVGENYPRGDVGVRRVDKRPPPQYTQSTLIAALDSRGIGRPSTYSNTVSIVLSREYAKIEGGKLEITELGLSLMVVLEKYFNKIMQYDYTRDMERSLDDISEKKADWKNFLNLVFDDFYADLNSARDDIRQNALTGERCSLCDGDLVYRISRRTKERFISCSNFPRCKYSSSVEGTEPEMAGGQCVLCKGNLIYRIARKTGQRFISCANYPTCKYSAPLEGHQAFTELLDESCPECNNFLIRRKGKWNTHFIGCSSYPKCRYMIPDRARKLELTGGKCSLCGGDLAYRVARRTGKKFISCVKYPTCKYIEKSSKDKDEKD